MKRVWFSFMVGAFLLALPGSALVWGKAHVPVDQVQICTSNGQVRNVKASKLQRELGRDGCRLTACVFNATDPPKQFIFLPKQDCDPTDNNDNGFCDDTEAFPAALSAIGVTPACTNPF